MSANSSYLVNVLFLNDLYLEGRLKTKFQTTFFAASNVMQAVGQGFALMPAYSYSG